MLTKGDKTVLKAEAIYTGDIHQTAFDCGCVWRWWVGKPSKLNNRWEKQCVAHASQVVPAECRCLNVGEDDGATTCWPHHDCSDGSCTHNE